MISASTRRRARLLAAEQAKALFRDGLRSVALRMGLRLKAWVVLDDHYHLLLRSGRGMDVPRFCAQFHGLTARQVNLMDGALGRRVWDNYWDSCVRSEADLWVRFNYIHLNPVKHGYVAHPEDWAYSSYDYYRRGKGEEWLQDCWSRYPVVDVLQGKD